MAGYTYEYPEGTTANWDLQIVRGKIYAAFDADPSTLAFGFFVSGGDDNYIVQTTRDLTTQEKTTLDATMAHTDLGILPTGPGWTIVRYPDIMNNWKSLEVSSAIDINFVWFNSATGKFEMWINSSVTPVKMNKLKQDVMALVEVETT